MIQFTQFPFLQALGYAILNSLWQFGLLWLIYLSINCVATLSSHKKYAAALTLQLAGFTWFITTLLFYYNKCVSLASSGLLVSDLSGFGNLPYTGSIKDKIVVGILRTELFLPYLALAYLVLLLVFGLRWIGVFLNTQHLKKQGLEKIDYNYRLFVEKISLQFGIKRPVRIFLSKLVKSPLTIGFIKPVILLPVATVNYLTCQQVEAILLHELAHIKRYDYLLNLLLSLIEITLFFNPFMQLICRHIKRERENSCDDWVLQYEYNASEYAAALLKLARNSQKMIPVLAMNAIDQKNSLLIRVKRMIEKKDRTFNYRNQLLALVFISTVLSVIAWYAPNTKKVASTKVPASETRTAPPAAAIEPLVATVDNPLFNPVFFLVEHKKHQQQVSGKNQVSLAEKFALVVTPAPPPAPPIPDAISSESAQIAAKGLTIAQIQDSIATEKNRIVAFTFEKALEKVDTLRFYRDISSGIANINQELKHLESKGFKVQTQVHKNEIKRLQDLSKSLQEVNRTLVKGKIALRIHEAQAVKILNINRNIAVADSSSNARYRILREEEIGDVERRLSRQLTNVAYQQYTGAATAWKPAVETEIILFAPNPEPEHTFSYDYKENFRTVAPAKVQNTRLKKAVDKNAVEQEEASEAMEEVFEIIVEDFGCKKAKASQTKKRVLKITRI